MIDVNMLPRELTGYVGHVCGMWFACHFNDFEPVFVHSTAGIIGELYEYLVDTVQDNSMNGGLDYEDAEEYAKLAATVPWSMEEIDRVAEQSFRYVSDRTLQVAYALCVLTFASFHRARLLEGSGVWSESFVEAQAVDSAIRQGSSR